MSKQRRLAALLVPALLLWSAAPARAWELFRSESGAVERGNAHLEKGEAAEALEAYDEAARELPNDPGVQLDRGLALLESGKLGEAREAFRRAASGSAPKELRAAALYDMGLTFVKEGEQAAASEDLAGSKKMLEEAVDAFKGSLRARPGNPDAAWNLELAKRRLVDVEKKQEEQKKEEEEKKKEEEEQKKEEEEKNEDEQNQDPQQGDGGSPEQPRDGDAGTPEEDGGAQAEPDEQPDAGAPEPPPEQGDAAAPAPPPEPSPQDPNALPEHMKDALDALEASEENLEKLRAQQRARSRPRRVEKDW